MTDTPDYTPPKVWVWNKENGGRFAKINRPIAGPTHDKELPVGRHPLQLYSLGTPNGKVTSGFGAFTNSIPVPPDPTTMREIAAATGGVAYTAQTAASVVQIYRTLGSSIGRTTKRVEITSWFAVAAALALLAALATGALFEGRLP